MKRNRGVYRTLTMIMQFGINMIVPIFMCSFLGMYLDRKLGTSFFMIVLFFLGAAAGFRNIYILAMKETSMEEAERIKEREARRNVSGRVSEHEKNAPDR